MSKNKTKSEIQSELEQAHRRIAELESAAGNKRFDGDPLEMSERRKMESALHESEGHYRALVETLDVSLCRWLPDTTLTYANEKYKKIFGVQGNAVGQKWLDFLPKETRTSTAAFYKEVAEHPRTVTYEHPVTVEDGGQREYHWTDTPIFDEYGKVLEFQSIGIDITGNKLAQEKIKESEERYRELFDDSPVSIWEEDFSAVKARLDGLRRRGVTDFRQYFSDHSQEVIECAALVKVLDVNKASISLLGAARKEDLLSSLEQTLKEEAIQGFTEELVNIAEGRTRFKWEGNNRRMDGTLIDIQVGWSVATGHEEDLSRVLVSITDITSRKRTEKALSESERKYRDLIDAMNDTVWIIDSDSRILDVNHAASRILGYSREEFLSMKVFDIDKALTAGQIQGLVDTMPTDKVQVFETWHTARDGKKLPVEISSSLVSYAGRTVIMSIARDITERKQMERALYLVSDTQKRMITVETPGDLHRLVGEKIQELIEDGFVGISRLDEETQSMGIAGIYGLGNNLETWLRRLKVDPTKQTYALDEMTADELRLYRSGSLEKFEGGLYRLLLGKIPKRICDLFEKEMHLDGIYTMGFIEQDIHLGGVTILARRDIQPLKEMIETLVRQAAIIIRRLQTEQALRASEERFATMFRSNPSAIAVSRLSDNVLVDMNNTWVKTTGWSREEALGKTPLELNLWADPSKREQLKKLIVEHGTIQGFEMKLRTRSGQIMNLLMSAEVITLQGESCMLSMTQDITGRKQAENELRDREELLSMMGRTARIGGWDFDVATGKGHWTEEVAHIHDLDPTAQTNREIGLSFYHGESKERIAAAIQAATEHGIPYDLELEIISATGTHKWVRTIGHPVLEDGRVVKLRGSFQDITDRKQAEERLANLEKRYRALIENAPDGIVLVGLDGRFKYASPSVEKIFGYTQEEALAGNPNEVTHPEDLPMVLAELALLLENPHYTPTLQYRFLHKSGEWRWIESTFSNLIALPSVEAIIINFRDIHERKIAEDALHKSQALLTEAQRIGRIGHMEWRGTGQNLVCSEEVYNILGLPHDAVITQNDFISRMTPGERERIRQLEGQLIQQRKETADYDYRIRLEDGSERWIHQIGRVTYGEDGVPIYMMAIIQDVTERKQTEEVLRESRSRIEMALKGANAAMWDWNVKTGEALFNERWAEMLGYTLQELEPVNIQTWTNLCHPDDLKVSDELLQKHFAGETNYYECEARMKHKDGSWVWVIDHGKVMEWDADGKPVRMFGTHLDITERKKSEEKLRRQMEDLAFVNALNQAANRGESLESIMEILRVEGRRTFRSRDVAIYLLSPDQRTISMQNGSLSEPLKSRIEKLIGRPIPQLQIPFQPGGFFDRSIHSEQGMITTEPMDLQEWMAEFAETPFLPELVRPGIKALIPSIFKLLGIRSVITIPLKSENRTLGVFEISSAELLSEQDLERLQNVRASLTEIIRRKQVEQELMESEEKYRGLMESLDNAVSTVDFEGRFTFMNDTAAETLGGSPQEFIGRNMKELFPEPFASLQLADIQNIFRLDQESITETQSMGKDGKLRWYRFALQPLHDASGQVVQVLINATDIHDLKAAQQELQDLNRTLEEKVAQRSAEVQDLYENAPTGYHSLDASGNFVMVNQTELNWLGYSREELMGHGIQNFMAEASCNLFRENFPLFMQRGWIKDLELEFIRKDGSILPVSLSATALRDEAGNFVMSRSTLFDITERKQAERILRESEETYRALFENSNDAIFLMSAVDGVFIKVNPRCAELLGYPAEELVGKNSTEFVDPLEAEDSDDRWKRLLRGERMAAYERRLIRNGGEVVETDINLNLIRDASGKPVLVQSVVRDITARKLAERALRESEEHNRLLFEESPVPVALLDETGHIVRVNRAYEQLTGIPRYVLYGKTSEEMGLVDSQVVNGLTEAMLHAMSKQEEFAIMEHTLTSADGTKRIVESRIFLLQINSINHILVTSNDISTHKKAEETLRHANVELERAMRMKDEFLATMSHELRTPLTGILGLSEALQLETYGKLSDKQLKTVRNIENSGRHLLTLINDVLDLSKIEAGKLDLDITHCSLEDICQASLQLTKGMAHQKRQNVRYAAPAESVAIEADPRRIKQVLVNLLSNAIKFTSENGELGLTVEPDKTNQQVRLVVWDKGIGIKPENLSKLFQPFTQIDGSLAREYSGTGLGLALVRRLVELHNGEAKVESVFGEGSRFIISLPWTPRPAQDNAPGMEDNEESQPSMTDENFSQPMILIADDNAVLLEMMGDFLEARSYRTTRVQSGQELLERIESVRPDIILMDIQMPGMDGLETIRRVRENKNAVIASTPIIAVTALAMPEDRDLCLEAGANDYISKPVKLKDLVDTLNQLTGR